MATKQIVWTSKAIDDVVEQMNLGFYPKGDLNPFFEGNIGFRKPGLTFKMTQNELEEYIKCKMDIHYFSENYCYVKGDQGEPIKLVLRDYQREILDNFFNNRFNILMASRQIGKCFSYNDLVVMDVEGVSVSVRIGKLYYDTLKQLRGLTILEKFKIYLYNILYKIENLPS